jgi:hypothetical protein
MAVTREGSLVACGAVLIIAAIVLLVLGVPASSGGFVVSVGIALCASSQALVHAARPRLAIFFTIGVGFAGFRLGALVSDGVTTRHVLAFVVQLVILVAVLVLGYDHAHGLHQLGTFVRRANAGYAPVLDEMSAVRAVEAELARSRRHGTPLTFLLLEPGSDPAAPAFQVAAAQVSREALLQLERVYARERTCELISEHVRRSDVVVCSQDRFLVMSGDTNAEGTKFLAERMVAAVHDELGMALRTGVAAFPVHGSTYSELVAVARAEANGDGHADAETTTDFGSPPPPRAEANQ